MKKYITDAENAKIKSTTIKVGDRVRVLDGSKIPNYTGGWCMYDLVGRIFTVRSIDKEWSDGRISAKLGGSQCNYDLRGLEKV